MRKAYPNRDLLDMDQQYLEMRTNAGGNHPTGLDYNAQMDFEQMLSDRIG